MDVTDPEYDLYADLAADVGVRVMPMKAREDASADQGTPDAVLGDGVVGAESSAPGKDKLSTSLSAQLDEARSQIAQLQAALQHKDSKLRASIRQNGVLLRNLSQLFVTAQAEITRLQPATDKAAGAAASAAPVPPANGVVPVVGASRKAAPVEDIADGAPSAKKARPC